MVLAIESFTILLMTYCDGVYINNEREWINYRTLNKASPAWSPGCGRLWPPRAYGRPARWLSDSKYHGCSPADCLQRAPDPL